MKRASAVPFPPLISAEVQYSLFVEAYSWDAFCEGGGGCSHQQLSFWVL